MGTETHNWVSRRTRELIRAGGRCARGAAAVALAAALAAAPAAPAMAATVTGRAHVASKGTLGWAQEGATIGTTGKGLRMEALWLDLRDSEYSGSLAYRLHLAGTGWEPGWAPEGRQAGTTGQGRRAEAVQIKLTGEVAKHYDVYYRAHVAGKGWLSWTLNGETAGTTGEARRLEAIQVKLVKKGESLVGQGHVSGIGWMGAVAPGEVIGTTGQGRRLEGVTLKIDGKLYSGGIKVRAHVAGKGWLDWVDEGQLAGTTGEARRMEAVQIKLTGEMAEHYDVVYQAHVASLGWLGEVRNGAVAGTTGQARRMEALIVRLVEKAVKDGKTGTDEPGTDTPGTDTPGTDDPGTDKPGTDDPGTDTPGTDDPGTDKPGTDDPGTDTPGTDTPSADDPDDDYDEDDLYVVQLITSEPYDVLVTVPAVTHVEERTVTKYRTENKIVGWGTEWTCALCGITRSDQDSHDHLGEHAAHAGEVLANDPELLALFSTDPTKFAETNPYLWAELNAVDGSSFSDRHDVPIYEDVEVPYEETEWVEVVDEPARTFVEHFPKGSYRDAFVNRKTGKFVRWVEPDAE